MMSHMVGAVSGENCAATKDKGVRRPLVALCQTPMASVLFGAGVVVLETTRACWTKAWMSLGFPASRSESGTPLIGRAGVITSAGLVDVRTAI